VNRSALDLLSIANLRGFRELDDQRLRTRSGPVAGTPVPGTCFRIESALLRARARMLVRQFVMRWHALFFVLPWVGYAAVQGCGSSNGPSDAGSDGTTNGGVITSWVCGPASVADCSKCAGYPQPCAYCNAFDASDLVGVCTTLHSTCLNAIPNNHTECTCLTGSASACPEGYEICDDMHFCHTCSDNASNEGRTCQNGNKCHYDGGCL